MTTRVRATLRSALSCLPRGHSLPPDVWRVRHRWVVGLLLGQSLLLPLVAVALGFAPGHALLDTALPFVFVALACAGRLGPFVRSAAAATGLMVVSTLLVHLTGGMTEAHFHFFVMVPIVGLYESWGAFGLAIGFVLLHHGVMGVLDPRALYNSPTAQQHPWWWAAIHTGAIAAACLAAIVNWAMHERSRATQRTLTDALSHRAHHDALTGLPNRTLFLDRLDQSLAEAERDGLAPTVLMLDLDGFKDVNDSFGHHYGDLVLIEVAARVGDCLRGGDTLTRLGGDEFAVLLPRTGAAGGTRTAQKITTSMNQPFEVDGLQLALEVSIGIAEARPGQLSATVVRHADLAMYVAKEQRLGFSHHEPDSETATVTRLDLLGDLRRAVDGGEIVLHYQPKVDLVTGEVVGVEALARWQHASRGLLPPSEFIPLLERTNLSRQFTAYVVNEALAQVRRWQDAGLRMPVSVNVPTRCLLDPRLADGVASALREHGVSGELLCVEITENTMMADPERAIGTLHRLRALGVLVSVDDFGTGHSSLAYLRTLPVDELKIDRMFVTGLSRDGAQGTALVRAAIDLAHGLGLTVVAEGVEDLDVARSLRALGCDRAQGYHYARPLPTVELLTWLVNTDRLAGRAVAG